AAGPVTVNLEWTPQRVVWAGLLVSAAGILLTAALALWPRRRRERAAQDGNGPEGPGMKGPEVSNPFAAAGSRPGLTTAALAAGGAGVVAGAISAPWAAAPVGALVLAACLMGRARAVLAVGAAASMAAAGAYVLVEQARHRFFSTIQWPGSFHLANSLGWAAVCLLAADALVVLIRSRGSQGDSEHRN
ncbi:MAG TPA: hypothetical protein VGR90_04615, partial [Acidimicrobiales bacterium]|nr:hypothetical protein [Acidimicrobiales bacterium]